jgi:hypothetical protein
MNNEEERRRRRRRGLTTFISLASKAEGLRKRRWILIGGGMSEDKNLAADLDSRIFFHMRSLQRPALMHRRFHVFEMRSRGEVEALAPLCARRRNPHARLIRLAGRRRSESFYFEEKNRHLQIKRRDRNDSGGICAFPGKSELLDWPFSSFLPRARLSPHGIRLASGRLSSGF